MRRPSLMTPTGTGARLELPDVDDFRSSQSRFLITWALSYSCHGHSSTRILYPTYTFQSSAQMREICRYVVFKTIFRAAAKCGMPPYETRPYILYQDESKPWKAFRIPPLKFLRVSGSFPGETQNACPNPARRNRHLLSIFHAEGHTRHIG